MALAERDRERNDRGFTLEPESIRPVLSGVSVVRFIGQRPERLATIATDSSLFAYELGAVQADLLSG